MDRILWTIAIFGTVFGLCHAIVLQTKEGCVPKSDYTEVTIDCNQKYVYISSIKLWRAKKTRVTGCSALDSAGTDCEEDAAIEDEYLDELRRECDSSEHTCQDLRIDWQKVKGCTNTYHNNMYFELSYHCSTGPNAMEYKVGCLERNEDTEKLLNCGDEFVMSIDTLVYWHTKSWRITSSDPVCEIHEHNNDCIESEEDGALYLDEARTMCNLQDKCRVELEWHQISGCDSTYHKNNYYQINYRCLTVGASQYPYSQEPIVHQEQHLLSAHYPDFMTIHTSTQQMYCTIEPLSAVSMIIHDLTVISSRTCPYYIQIGGQSTKECATDGWQYTVLEPSVDSDTQSIIVSFIADTGKIGSEGLDVRFWIEVIGGNIKVTCFEYVTPRSDESSTITAEPGRGEVEVSQGGLIAGLVAGACVIAIITIIVIFSVCKKQRPKSAPRPSNAQTENEYTEPVANGNTDYFYTPESAQGKSTLEPPSSNAPPSQPAPAAPAPVAGPSSVAVVSNPHLKQPKSNRRLRHEEKKKKKNAKNESMDAQANPFYGGGNKPTSQLDTPVPVQPQDQSSNISQTNTERVLNDFDEAINDMYAY